MTIVGVCLTGLLYGCTKVEQPEEITLYVEAHNPSYFMQNYGIPFELQNIHIRDEVTLIEPCETSNEFEDLVMVERFELYDEMVENGELALLDPFILKNSNLFSDLSYDKNKAMDIFREHSDRQLYALPLYLMGFALYYNADLFDEYDVPYPTDFMSWDEMFMLASQFPLETDQGERIYGLAHSYAHYHVALAHLTVIGSRANMFMVDDEWKMTMNTPEWAEIWNTAIPAMKSGYVDISANNDFTPNAVLDYPFIDGRAAMISATPDVAYQLINEKKEEERFKWNVVAGPITPEYPFTTAYSLWGAYGMNDQSSDKEEAWELLRFIFEKAQYSSSSVDG